MPTVVKDFKAKSLESIFDIRFVEDPFSQLLRPPSAGQLQFSGSAFTMGASLSPMISGGCYDVAMVILAVARAVMNAVSLWAAVYSLLAPLVGLVQLGYIVSPVHHCLVSTSFLSL